MREQKHGEIWIRWAMEAWEKDGTWTTSIQKNILEKNTFKEALFILQDDRCVFVPMEEMIKVLSAESVNAGGTIMVRIHPSRMTINETPAKMNVVTSRTHRVAHPNPSILD